MANRIRRSEHDTQDLDKKEVEILLVRHGFTPANNAGWNHQDGIREIFRYDETCPLDDEYGIKQAKELGEFLKDYISGKKVLFLVSPYERTKQTLRIARESFSEPHNLITYEERAVLREINQGLNYGRSKEHFEEDDREVQEVFEKKKTGNSPAIAWMNGESERDVVRRLRSFSDELKKIKESGKYDTIIVLSHETINKCLYSLLYGREMLDKEGKKLRQLTASVIRASKTPEVIFEPTTEVPKGYHVDIESNPRYQAYMKNKDDKEWRRSMRKNLEELVHKYRRGKELTQESVGKNVFVPREGFNLIIPEGNKEEHGYFLVDSKQGHDCYSYNTKSKHIYHILDGEGEFIIAGKPKKVLKGDVITIEPGQEFYYSGTMLMMLEMTPNFKEENEKVTQRVSYGINIGDEEESER